MTGKMLAVTRWLVGAAVTVTGFIVTHSQKIILAAQAVHAWALRTSMKLAEKQTLKAYTQYDNALAVVDAARKVAYDRFNAYSAAADRRDLLCVAAEAELASLK